jgi:DNA invertase Pin-like site-specific DNA recombinase
MFTLAELENVIPVVHYLNGGTWSLVGKFTEIESGKRNGRLELEKASTICKWQKAKLVIAKLDRLSRNLAFIATLMDSSVEFIAVDNPHANKLTVHILAAVAQHEREMIASAPRMLCKLPRLAVWCWAILGLLMFVIAPI